MLIVVTTYSGNLVAFLTFPQIENPVNTLNDLLKLKDSMSWGYIGGTILQEYFKVRMGTEGCLCVCIRTSVCLFVCLCF